MPNLGLYSKTVFYVNLQVLVQWMCLVNETIKYLKERVVYVTFKWTMSPINDFQIINPEVRKW